MNALDWIDKHRIISGIVILWSLGIVTFVTWAVFIDPPDIKGGTAAALATVYGLPALAVSLVKWRGSLITTNKETVINNNVTDSTVKDAMVDQVKSKIPAPIKNTLNGEEIK